MVHTTDSGWEQQSEDPARLQVPDWQAAAGQPTRHSDGWQGCDRCGNPSWQQDKEERAWEDLEVPGAEEATGADVEGEVHDDP